MRIEGRERQTVGTAGAGGNGARGDIWVGLTKPGESRREGRREGTEGAALLAFSSSPSQRKVHQPSLLGYPCLRLRCEDGDKTVEEEGA